jgi:hypothetical protein
MVSPSAIPGQNPINPQVLYPMAPIFPPINPHKYNSFPLIKDYKAAQISKLAVSLTTISIATKL